MLYKTICYIAIFHTAKNVLTLMDTSLLMFSTAGYQVTNKEI